MIIPFTIDEHRVFNNQLESTPKESLGFNFGTFSKPVQLAPSGEKEPMKPVVKKSKKAKKQTKTLSNGAEYVPVDSDRELSHIETNTPYLNSYDETANLLKVTISQIDNVTAQVNNELETVRSSKTLKNKYQYIPNLASTVSALISSKISAIREINSSITNSHNLDLKRVKELKLNEVDKDDDKAIMDLYNMFVTNPNAALTPMNNTSMYNPGIGGINRVGLGDDSGLQYTQGSEKMFNAMINEHNPNIKTVVKYDQTTGARYFDVINTQTGESIPGVDRPAPMFLEDTTLDVNIGIARNANLDTTYPIVLVGNSVDNY